MIKGFQDLEVWRKAHKLVLEIYKLTNMFPRGEQFGIVSQLRRAAYSIPANLAEGYGRRSTKEFLQFVAIANGSAEELRYFLILSRDSLRLRASGTAKSRSSRDTEHGSRDTNSASEARD